MSKVISIRVPRNIHDKLAKEAVASSRSISFVVREAIMEYLIRLKFGKKRGKITGGTKK